jgi:hypothetical protein
MPLATLTLNVEFSTNPTKRIVEIRYVIGGGGDKYRNKEGCNWLWWHNNIAIRMGEF